MCPSWIMRTIRLNDMRFRIASCHARLVETWLSFLQLWLSLSNIVFLLRSTTGLPSLSNHQKSCLTGELQDFSPLIQPPLTCRKCGYVAFTRLFAWIVGRRASSNRQREACLAKLETRGSASTKSLCKHLSCSICYNNISYP